MMAWYCGYVGLALVARVVPRRPAADRDARDCRCARSTPRCNATMPVTPTITASATAPTKRDRSRVRSDDSRSGGSQPAGSAIEAPLGERPRRFLAHLGVDRRVVVGGRELGPRAARASCRSPSRIQRYAATTSIAIHRQISVAPIAARSPQVKQPERQEPRVPDRVLGPLHEQHAEHRARARATRASSAGGTSPRRRSRPRPAARSTTAATTAASDACAWSGRSCCPSARTNPLTVLRTGPGSGNHDQSSKLPFGTSFV